jgi:hypothetical protein
MINDKRVERIWQREELPHPSATPFSKFSLDYRHSDARIVENGFAASSGVSKSAKVVLEHQGPVPADLEEASQHRETL